MITLKVEPYCHSCNDFEAHVAKMYSHDQLYDTFVKCKNCERCDALANHIKEEMSNDVQREISD